MVFLNTLFEWVKIVSLMIGMAFHDSSYGKVGALERSIFLHRFQRILRAGRGEPTARFFHGRNILSVEPYSLNYY